MGSNRLAYRTSIGGLYLCGACTHPGGSVVGINGSNAAYEISGGSIEPRRVPGLMRAVSAQGGPKEGPELCVPVRQEGLVEAEADEAVADDDAPGQGV